jgi:glycerophosphoryl diester phosphodiesterase
MSFSWWATRFASKLPYNDVYLVNRAIQLSYMTRSTAGLNIEIIRKSPEIVSALHSRGKKVFVWTVNEESDISLCKQNKVDVIITDNVSLAKTL